MSVTTKMLDFHKNISKYQEAKVCLKKEVDKTVKLVHGTANQSATSFSKLNQIKCLCNTTLNNQLSLLFYC